jgi:hypothetical protein
MKRFILIPCLLLSTAALAQYSIDRHTVGGGGGTSAGGQFSLTGTIGQRDTGATSANGQYALAGGFWAFPHAVQTPGAPTLTITPAALGLATIAWTPNNPGFVLQESASIASGWTNSISGATNPVTVSASSPAKFYRLNKP